MAASFTGAAVQPDPLSQKVLASLRILNESLVEVRDTVARLNQPGGAASPHRASVTELDGLARTAAAAGLCSPLPQPLSDGDHEQMLESLLRKLITSPAMSGAKLSAGLKQELRRMLDDATAAAAQPAARAASGGSRASVSSGSASARSSRRRQRRRAQGSRDGASSHDDASSRDGASSRGSAGGAAQRSRASASPATSERSPVAARGGHTPMPRRPSFPAAGTTATTVTTTAAAVAAASPAAASRHSRAEEEEAGGVPASRALRSASTDVLAAHDALYRSPFQHASRTVFSPEAYVPDANILPEPALRYRSRKWQRRFQRRYRRHQRRAFLQLLERAAVQARECSEEEFCAAVASALAAWEAEDVVTAAWRTVQAAEGAAGEADGGATDQRCAVASVVTEHMASVPLLEEWRSDSDDGYRWVPVQQEEFYEMQAVAGEEMAMQAESGAHDKMARDRAREARCAARRQQRQEQQRQEQQRQEQQRQEQQRQEQQRQRGGHEGKQEGAARAAGAHAAEPAEAAVEEEAEEAEEEEASDASSCDWSDASADESVPAFLRTRELAKQSQVRVPKHAALALPVVYERYRTGFEEDKDFKARIGTVVAGRYLVEGFLGEAAFSSALRCVDLASEKRESVCLKVVKNNKDYFDQLRKFDELDCLVRGVLYLLETTPTGFTIAHPEERERARKVPYDPNTVLFPFLIVNVGSGVSILKVTSPSRYERVGGTSLGGATFYGLASLLTQCATFEEALALADKGDNTKVDMLVRDIYGGDYEAFNLSGSTVASSFGKLVRPGNWHAASREDLARAALFMIVNNIGALANLHAKQVGTKRIIFTGNFLRNNKIAHRTLSFATEYWSEGTTKAMFLEHAGYAGAIGALLYSFEPGPAFRAHSRSMGIMRQRSDASAAVAVAAGAAPAAAEAGAAAAAEASAAVDVEAVHPPSTDPSALRHFPGAADASAAAGWRAHAVSLDDGTDGMSAADAGTPGPVAASIAAVTARVRRNAVQQAEEDSTQAADGAVGDAEGGEGGSGR